MSEKLFNTRIVELSESGELIPALKEWKLVNAYEDIDICICGKNPIKRICVVENIHNRNTAIIGSSCVEKFLGIPSSKIFTDLKKVEGNERALLDVFTLTFLHNNSIINDWEFDFYGNVIKYQRRLSDKQVGCLIKVNNKLLYKLRNK